MIPKLIHFIFGFSKDPGKFSFNYVHYLGILSAHKVHPQHKIVMWAGLEPIDNFWWDEAKKLFELIIINPPTEIFGNPLLHYAHQADVFRLMALKDYGGIYLDIDTLTVKNFDLLNVTEFAMAPEWNPIANKIQGLCNATIISRKNSSFAHRWLDSFEFFNSQGRDINWEFHAVKVPLILSRQRMDDIRILPQNTFFKFDWSQKSYKDLFVNSVDVSDVWSIHLWENNCIEILNNINEDFILNNENTYSNIAKKYLVFNHE